MKKILFYLVFLNLIYLNIALAEIYKFFEFSPDFGNKIPIEKDKEYIQRFVPFNDFLSMIRLWIENIGPLTSLNFTLLDKENNILESKIINLPPTNFSWSGIHFDIPLNENIRINSGQEYKFKLTTNQNSNLKIFAFNILELLQNIEATLNIPETIRPLIINDSEEKNSFKISLYEGTENLSPIISNLSYQLINQNLVKITFNANEPIIYKLIYYDNISYSTNTYQNDYYESCPPNIRLCSGNIDIQAEREYYVKLIVFDYWQNSSTAEINFNTYSNNNNNENIDTDNNTSSENFSININNNLPSSKYKNKVNIDNLDTNKNNQQNFNQNNIVTNSSEKNNNPNNQKLEKNKIFNSKIRDNNILEKNEYQNEINLNLNNLENNYQQRKEKEKINFYGNNVNKVDKYRIDYFKIIILSLAIIITISVLLGNLLIKRKK
ncbi:MAG: hypothetical protein KatS3mg094_510 [Candidatus Parcubacteria bacterium]|nr:MAG: hypothetical protein KatS3mg094_510 [Candidatus Parcubacteria bacterium]